MSAQVFAGMYAPRSDFLMHALHALHAIGATSQIAQVKRVIFCIPLPSFPQFLMETKAKTLRVAPLAQARPHTPLGQSPGVGVRGGRRGWRRKENR